jgi:hypothetical protein
VVRNSWIGAVKLTMGVKMAQRCQSLRSERVGVVLTARLQECNALLALQEFDASRRMVGRFFSRTHQCPNASRCGLLLN